VVEATGHSYGAVVTEPTCTDAGYTTYTCSSCEDSYRTEEVAALGHTEAIDAKKEPTCSETGLTEGKHCSVCNEVLVAQEVVDALGHSYSEDQVSFDWAEDYSKCAVMFACTRGNCKHAAEATSCVVESETAEATCVEDGSIVYKATAVLNVAGMGVLTVSDSKTEVLEKTGHRYGVPEFTWDGYATAMAVFTCENEHCPAAEKTVEKTCVITSKTTAATCENEGETIYTASVAVSGNEYAESGTFTATKTESLAKLGHVYGDWVRTKAPSVDEEGEERRDCQRCDAHETRPVEKLLVVLTFVDNNTVRMSSPEGSGQNLWLIVATYDADDQQQDVVMQAVGDNAPEKIDVKWNRVVQPGWRLKAFVLNGSYAPVCSAGERMAE